MTGGVGFASDGTSRMRNNRKLRKRDHSLRNEMNLPESGKSTPEDYDKMKAFRSERTRRTQSRFLIALLLLTIVGIAFVYFLIQ